MLALKEFFHYFFCLISSGRKRPLGGIRHRWKDNIKMILERQYMGI
jgi:hypothetical protein